MGLTEVQVVRAEQQGFRFATDKVRRTRVGSTLLSERTVDSREADVGVPACYMFSDVLRSSA